MKLKGISDKGLKRLASVSKKATFGEDEEYIQYLVGECRKYLSDADFIDELLRAADPAQNQLVLEEVLRNNGPEYPDDEDMG